MPNANHGAKRPSISSDVKGGDNTSQQDEVMEIHSQVLEMIEIFKRMSAMLETIETQSKEQHDSNLQVSVREDRDVTRTGKHYFHIQWALLLTVQQVSARATVRDEIRDITISEKRQ